MAVEFAETEIVERLRSRRFINMLMLANLTFAAAVLMFWTRAGIVVEAPWNWGTSATIGKLSSWRNYLEYPFVLLWALPLVCVIAARVGLNSGRHKFAVAVALMPLMIFSLTVGIYNFAPLEWR